VFAVCVANVTANVPVVVIGEPATLNVEGIVSATEETVPVPPATLVCTTVVSLTVVEVPSNVLTLVSNASKLDDIR
jgi:hypothetical protein